MNRRFAQLTLPSPLCTALSLPVWGLVVAGAVFAVSRAPLRAAELPGATRFHKQIEPLLKEYCYDCHGDGMNKGGVAWDGFKSDQEI